MRIRVPELKRDFKFVVFGESLVGKTCFTDMFNHGHHFVSYSAVNLENRGRDLTAINLNQHVDTMDINSSTIREGDPQLNPQFFVRMLQEADGIVLMYDLTNYETFYHVTNHAYMYLSTCKKFLEAESKDCQREIFSCVLVGNKADLVANDPTRRQIDKDEAEQWAQSQGFQHFEVTANSGHGVENVLAALVKNVLKVQADRRKDSEKENRTRNNNNGNTETSIRSKIKGALIKTKSGQ